MKWCPYCERYINPKRGLVSWSWSDVIILLLCFTPFAIIALPWLSIRVLGNKKCPICRTNNLFKTSDLTEGTLIENKQIAKWVASGLVILLVICSIAGLFISNSTTTEKVTTKQAQNSSTLTTDVKKEFISVAPAKQTKWINKAFGCDWYTGLYAIELAVDAVDHEKLCQFKFYGRPNYDTKWLNWYYQQITGNNPPPGLNWICVEVDINMFTAKAHIKNISFSVIGTANSYVIIPIDQTGKIRDFSLIQELIDPIAHTMELIVSDREIQRLNYGK
jgi:hypothetical protein